MIDRSSFRLSDGTERGDGQQQQPKDRHVDHERDLISHACRNGCRMPDPDVGHYGRRNLRAAPPRTHQGLGNELIAPTTTVIGNRSECRERLGGLLKFYYRQAA
jgi:hypothetical protein